MCVCYSMNVYVFMYDADVSEPAAQHDEISAGKQSEGLREGGASAGPGTGSEPAHARSAQE